MNLESRSNAESDRPSHEVHIDSSMNGTLTVDELLRHRDREFVVTAYRRILGREPDPEGLHRFLSELRAGALEKVEILGNLRFSAEGRARGAHVKGLLLPYSWSVLRHSPRYATRLRALIRSRPIAVSSPNKGPAIESRLAMLENGWREHVPAFLNAVSTVRAFGFELVQAEKRLRQEFEQRLDAVRKAADEANDALRGELRGELRDYRESSSAGIAQMRERLEFVRSEVLYENKYGHANGDGKGSAAVSIRSPQKLAAADGRGVRLNLGCGHIPLEDYINVDQRDLPGVDIVAPADQLPLAEGSVREIFSTHMLEHFPQEELRRRLLPYWFGLLGQGGEFRAVVPDGEAMLAGLASSGYPFEDFREVLFGGQEYSGDFHYNLFTPDSLRRLLTEAGFRDIDVPVRGRRNGKCYEFEIIALKP